MSYADVQKIDIDGEVFAKKCLNEALAYLQNFFPRTLELRGFNRYAYENKPEGLSADREIHFKPIQFSNGSVYWGEQLSARDGTMHAEGQGILITKDGHI